MTDIVGKNINRLDGVGKVTGQAKYLDDMKIDGCWYGAVWRSPIQNGKIKKVSYKESFDWSQVVTCDHTDIPGKNCTTFLTQDQPILAKEYVRHAGEAVVLIAAPTKELADEAKENIQVEFEELPIVDTVEDSKKADVIIFGKDNIISKYNITKGDVAIGFKEADHIVEGEYKTGIHEHLYIEPQSMAALPREDGGLTVLGSVQCPYYVLKSLKEIFACDETRLNMQQTITGGAFGGKEDYPSLMGAYVGLLALKAKKPVKMVYDREEDLTFTTKRHPCVTRHKTGVKKDGSIVAMQIEIEMDGGAYTTISPVVLSRGIIHSVGPYKCAHVLANAKCYATNRIPNGAYRGFGVPQTVHAAEVHFDKVAKAVGLNPYEFRLKNCVHVGDSLATSQVLRESVAAEESLIKAIEATDFVNQWQKNQNQDPHSPIKKGIGISLYMHGGAFTGSGEAMMKTEAGFLLKPDGTISILTGCVDMGQGAHTVLPQIAASRLKVSIDHMSCVMPDTAVVPDSGPTVASRTTMIIGWVMEKCADTFTNKFLHFVSALKNISFDDLLIKDSCVFAGIKKIDSFQNLAKEFYKKEGPVKVIERYQLPKWIKWDAEKHFGDAYPAYSWAADVAEVSVDTDTFEVTLDKMTVAVDVGKAVNPHLLQGNIEGGTLQAIGWGLMEDSAYKNGLPTSNRLQTYIIPTIKDAPEWNTIIIEDPFSEGPRGVKGIGELPTDGAAPAILNAVNNALGTEFSNIPLTPEKIYEGVKL